jgi:hypothetical protein
MDAKVLRQLLDTMPAFRNGAFHLPEEEVGWLERAKLLMASASFQELEENDWQQAVSWLEYNGLRDQGRRKARELFVKLQARAEARAAASAKEPPEDGFPAATQPVLMMSLVAGTRGYIERIANQINGTYENGWYDACGVMIRRLTEILIIEVFEHHGLADRIKGPSGDFLFLRELIDKTLAETAWNLGRTTKQALPKLKDLGDKSAHNRRYNAKRRDVEPLIPELRGVVEELLYLSALRK